MQNLVTWTLKLYLSTEKRFYQQTMSYIIVFSVKLGKDMQT